MVHRVCVFWHVSALPAAGHRGAARALFGNLPARSNRPGLLPSHFDPTTGELWGECPQNSTMVGPAVSPMPLPNTCGSAV
jgi:GH15 family glucan-1,4-alpha-glucosidase